MVAISTAVAGYLVRQTNLTLWFVDKGGIGVMFWVLGSITFLMRTALPWFSTTELAFYIDNGHWPDDSQDE